MICSVCKVNKATFDEYYGWLPCVECINRQAKRKRPGAKIPEFAGDDIREKRKMFSDDIHPAHRKGVASREFLETWGEKAMLNQGFTKEEIKNSKYVWSGDSKGYYKKGN